MTARSLDDGPLRAVVAAWVGFGPVGDSGDKRGVARPENIPEMGVDMI
jgi:hypothetical protein